MCVLSPHRARRGGGGRAVSGQPSGRGTNLAPGEFGRPLLECRSLHKTFAMPPGNIKPVCRRASRGNRGNMGPRKFSAVANVSLKLHAGETLGLVGESGCGKSTLARTLGLLYRPDAGSIRFRGDVIAAGPKSESLAAGARRKVKDFRRAVQMVFQDPFGSLNPRLSIRSILTEPLRIHGILRGTRATQERALELAATVGLPADVINRYPHELSGGQRQRVAIGRAMALNPEVIIADEPLSALDVSVQSQILNLFDALRASHGLSYLFISHDLAAVEHLSDRVSVMYCGRVVESADRDELFARPRHPYTRALIDAVPSLPGPGATRLASVSLASGEVPSVIDPPPGCAYSPRCPRADAQCRMQSPAFIAGSRGLDGIACHHPLGD